MPNAVANRALILFGKESAYGSTLASTVLKRLRFVSESIQHQANRAYSGQIEPDRNRVEVMDLAKSAAGGLDCELSYTDMEGLLRSAIGAGAGLSDTPVSGTTRYKNGTALDTYYFEKQFLDIAAFVGVYGAAINECTLTFEANREIQVQFGLVAQKTTQEAATRSTSVTAAATDAVMRCGADVAHIKLGGSAIAAAVQRLVISIRNNISPTTQVTADAPTAMQAHSFEVSGSMLAYFPTTALYEDMLANTSRALEVLASNAAGALTFQLPAIKLTGGTPPIGGQNTDVMVELPFMAQKGAGADDFTFALDVNPA